MSSTLTAARMSYAAAVVGCVTYGQPLFFAVITALLISIIGCYAIIAIIALHYLLKHRRRSSQRLVLAYTISLFVINTIYFIAAAKWSELEFVESTVNPGIFATLESSPIAILKNSTFVICIWLADSLIVSSSFFFRSFAFYC